MMLPDELTLAVELYKNATATVGSLWTLYSGAALALLGYVMGSKEPVPGRGKIGLAIVFVAFSIANVLSLCRAQSIAYAASMTIAEISQSPNSGVSASVQGLLRHLVASSPSRIVTFQLVLTVCALLAIAAAHRHETWTRNHKK